MPLDPRVAAARAHFDKRMAARRFTSIQIRDWVADTEDQRGRTVCGNGGVLTNVLTGFTGWWGGYSIKTDSEDSPTGDGSLDGSGRLGAKTIGVVGKMRALGFPTEADATAALYERLDYLSALLAAEVRTADLVVTEGQRGLTRKVNVRLAQDPDHTWVNPYTVNWTLNLHAADPIRYDNERTPFQRGQSLVVTNRGTVMTRPLLDYWGPLVNPWFEKDGLRMTLLTTIPAGVALTADARRRRVTNQDIQTFTPTTAQWPNVRPGPATFSFGADSGTGYGVLRQVSGWM